MKSAEIITQLHELQQPTLSCIQLLEEPPEYIHIPTKEGGIVLILADNFVIEVPIGHSQVLNLNGCLCHQPTSLHLLAKITDLLIGQQQQVNNFFIDCHRNNTQGDTPIGKQPKGDINHDHNRPRTHLRPMP
jgi:hypothetical protein